LPIFWNRGLQEFDPCAKLPLGIDEQIADAAMGKFLMEADGMLRISEEDA